MNHFFYFLDFKYDDDDARISHALFILFTVFVTVFVVCTFLTITITQRIVPLSSCS